MNGLKGVIIIKMCGQGEFIKRHTLNKRKQFNRLIFNQTSYQRNDILLHFHTIKSFTLQFYIPVINH